MDDVALMRLWLFVLSAALFGVLSYFAGRRRTIGGGLGLVLGLCLGCLGFLIVTAFPTKPATRKCPYCAERVRVAARVCRYCRNNLAVPPEGD